MHSFNDILNYNTFGDAVILYGINRGYFFVSCFVFLTHVRPLPDVWVVAPLGVIQA